MCYPREKKKTENLLNSVQLQRTVHARRGEILGVLAEPDAGGQRRVVVEHLQLLPLLAQVDSVKNKLNVC